MNKHFKTQNIKTVILGIGNILLGDEGIGIHVIKKVEKMSLPPHVKVIDGATAGYSLLPIFETYKKSKFLIVDAIKISKETSSDKNPLNTFKDEATQENITYDIYKNKSISLIKKKSIKKRSFKKNRKKGNLISIKGDIYTIPLRELYNISKSNYLNLEFISFHQTGLMDVLTLLYMTSKIKIEGCLIGINIFNSSNNANLFHTFSMKLSKEIEQKIPEIIEILKKHI